MNRRRSYAVVVLAVSSLILASPANSVSAASGTKASSARSLLPRPYVVEKSISGDFDKDGDLDVAIVGVDGPAVLEENSPEAGEGNRVLLVAQKVPGGYVTAGLGKGALLCRACGGAFWGINPAPIDLSVSRGVLSVAQSAGSREVTDWLHRYRIEKGKVRLIGLDRSVNDRATGAWAKSSTNLLTGVTITTGEGALDPPVKIGTRKGRPSTVFLPKVEIS